MLLRILRHDVHVRSDICRRAAGCAVIGVGSARENVRRTKSDDAISWTVGDKGKMNAGPRYRIGVIVPQ